MTPNTETVVTPDFIKKNGAKSTAISPVVAVEKAVARPVAKSKLKAVDPKAAEPSKPKILIFGKPGVGKTWTSLDFPSCYYIDTEGGANLQHYTDKLKASGGAYMGPEHGSQNFEEVIGQVKALATEQHPYRTLVIDSISKLHGNEIAEALEKMGAIANTYGAEKKPAIAHTRCLFNWLQRLDMNIILIAHETAEWGVVMGKREQIGVTFDAWDKLAHDLHLCLNIVKTGDTRKAFVKKSRLVGFPDASSFAWSYDEFSKRYGKEIMEGKVKQVVLATPEQLAEFRTLLSVVKLPEGQEAKWFKAAGVDNYEEMDSDKIDKLIGYVKKTLSTPNQGDK